MSEENKGIDLSEFESVEPANEGSVMTVLHPATFQPLRDDDGKETTITLAGMDSKVAQKAQRTATNKRLQARGKGKITAEQLEAESLELLARCTLGWSGISYKSVVLECNINNARMLYTELPWLREQVDDFIGDRANFLATS